METRVPDSVEALVEQPLPAVATIDQAAGIRVERIDDDQLLDLLSEIGRPAGLARINGRIELVAMDNPPADGP